MMPDEFDSMIDSALREIGSAGPPCGLENRVLNRVRFEGVRPHRTAWWHWALAGAAAATITIMWIPSGPRDAPALTPVDIHHPAPPPIAFSRSQPAARKRLSRREVPLVALVARYPEGLAALAELQQKQSDPVDIPDLTIQPIKIETLSEDKSNE